MTHLDETIISSTTDDTAAERRCPVCGILVPDEIERCPNDGTAVSVPAQSELKSRYEFLEPIGKGGMSVVYKARHRLMGNLVAIKLLQDKLTDNAAHVKRFQQEAQAAGRLDHSNLIKVYDFGVLSSGYTFLVMDYADGQSLSEVVRSEGHLSGERALPVFMQICDGLSHAHAKGILHRDLKPSNVILIKDPQLGERVKVVDFGIAKLTAEEGAVDNKLTATGEVFGSPYYMSPEQCSGSPVDQRSDVYSMGCLMYEVLSGRVPLAGTNVFETIHKQISEVPEPLSKHVSDATSIALSGVVAKALAKDPSDRYQNFGEMLSDLQKVAGGKKVSTAVRMPRAGGKYATAAGCGVLVAISLACYISGIGPFAPHVVPAPPAVAPPVAEPERPVIKADLTPKQLAVMEFQRYPFTNEAKMNSAELNDNNMELLSRNRRARLISVQDNPRITSKGVATFANHLTVENLFLDGTSVDNEGLAALGNLPRLRQITLGNTHVTPDGFKYLVNFPALEELWLEDLNLRDADLTKLPYMPRVTKLKLDDNGTLTDAALPLVVKACPNVEHLTLRNTGITDGAIPELLKLRKLAKLSVYGCRLSGRGEATLVEHNERLTIDFKSNYVPGTTPWRRTAGTVGNIGGEFVSSTMTDDALKMVATDLTIQRLALADSIDVTSRGVMALRNNHSIRFLNLCRTSIDDECMPVLTTLSNMQKLEVSRTKVTSASFSNFARMKNLFSLVIGNLNLNTEDIRTNFPKLPQLSTLVLDHNKELNDAALRLIVQKCPNLTLITVRETDISDAAVDELLKLKHLKSASVAQTRMTKAAKDRLLKHQIELY